MAQCERTLESGERCSNQANPGTPYCQTHRRITFTRATKRADTAPQSATVRRASSPKTNLRNWRAIPSAAGQEPAFPGLHVDAHNILVAPQGIIYLQVEDTHSQFNRLVRLLGLLSQEFTLVGQVRILFQAEGANYVLYLTPTQRESNNLSVFYDTVSAATRFVNGQIYIGQDNAFIQYRDDGAPRGYDVPRFKSPGTSKELFLVAHWGCQLLALSNFTEVSLRDLCLHIAPVPATPGQALERVYALIPPALYPLLAKYFYAHHLRYRLARLQAPRGERILFEISPRPDAPAGQSVPAFILDYLSRLPQVVLLVSAHQTGDLSILLHWKHRYPLHIPHIATAFAPADMILLIAEQYPNLRINPVPSFFDGDQLVDVHILRPRTLHLEHPPTSKPATVQLEILLRPDNGPVPPIAALLLSAQEMLWLRQLLYLLPGDVFSLYTLYQGEELSILSGGNQPIVGVPFGIPLRRPGNRELFIPLRSRFLPDVPWPLLHEVLAIQERVYTFLTPDGRIDLPEALFAPLSRTLVAAPHRPHINITMSAPSTLPDLYWTSPPEPELALPSAPTRRNRLFNRPASASQEVPAQVPQDNRIEEATLWREKARACEMANDFLAAAICYGFLNDISNSARCYRRAASELQSKEHEGGRI